MRSQIVKGTDESGYDGLQVKGLRGDDMGNARFPSRLSLPHVETFLCWNEVERWTRF